MTRRVLILIGCLALLLIVLFLAFAAWLAWGSNGLIV